MSDEYDDAAYTEADLVTAATLARLEAERASVRTLLAFAAAEGLSAASVFKALSGTNAAPSDPPVDDGDDADDDDTDLWTPARKAFDLHHDATDAERLSAAVEVALQALEDGSDPEEALARLHEHGTFEKGHWDPALHPKGKDGRFIKKDDIQAAKSDPKKAAELKKQVKDPEERKKLDKLLADPTPIGTKRGLAKHEAETKRAQKVADRAKAREIRIRLIDQDSRGEELNPDDLRALIPHLGQMSHEELSHTRELLARQGASFGGKRLRADRVAALVAWATGKAQPQPVEAEGGSGAGFIPKWQRDEPLNENEPYAQAGSVPDEEPAEKQPWQMSRKEYMRGAVRGITSDKLQGRADEHHAAVRDAILAGKPVPDDVAYEFFTAMRNDGRRGKVLRPQDVSVEEYVAKDPIAREMGEEWARKEHRAAVEEAIQRGKPHAPEAAASYREGKQDGPPKPGELGSEARAAVLSRGWNPDNLDGSDVWDLQNDIRQGRLSHAAFDEIMRAKVAHVHRRMAEHEQGLADRGFNIAGKKPLSGPLAQPKPDTGTAAAQPAPTGTSAAPPKTRLQALAEKAHAAGTPSDDPNTEYATPRDQYLAFTRAVVPPSGTKPDSATVLDYLSKLPDHARERLDQHFRASGKSLREIEQYHKQAAGQVTPEQVRAERAARADAGDAARAAMAGSVAGEMKTHGVSKLPGGSFISWKLPGRSFGSAEEAIAAVKAKKFEASDKEELAKYVDENSDHFAKVNGHLRGGPVKLGFEGVTRELKPKEKKEAQKTHEALQRAFASEPPATAPETYRGMVLDKGAAEGLLSRWESAAQSGEPLTLPGYTATSFDRRAAAEQFTDPGDIPPENAAGVVMTVRNPSGLDMGKLVGGKTQDRERELLLNHNSRFRVVSVNRGEGGNPSEVVVEHLRDDQPKTGSGAAPTPTGTSAAPDLAALKRNPKADLEHIASLQKQHAEGSPEWEALETARFNAQNVHTRDNSALAALHGKGKDAEAHGRRHFALERLASAAAQSHEQGDAAGHKAATDAMTSLGGTLHGPKAGATTAFDGSLYESPVAAFTGDAVRVISQPVTYNGALVYRGKVEPVASGSGAAPAAGGGGSEPPKVPSDPFAIEQMNGEATWHSPATTYQVAGRKFNSKKDASAHVAKLKRTVADAQSEAAKSRESAARIRRENVTRRDVRMESQAQDIDAHARRLDLIASAAKDSSSIASAREALDRLISEGAPGSGSSRQREHDSLIASLQQSATVSSVPR